MRALALIALLLQGCACGGQVLDTAANVAGGQSPEVIVIDAAIGIGQCLK